jgi:hypothetical protein
MEADQRRRDRERIRYMKRHSEEEGRGDSEEGK